MAHVTPFFDLARLLELRAIIRDLAPSEPPRLAELVSPGRQLRRLAFLPGSFNPPTIAHLALADRVLGSGYVDGLSYALASRTVDKERVEVASLADRLLLLTELVKGRPREGVALLNRGLYVEQAEIIRRALPGLGELWFVVGYDKIVQIFDPRYYPDRDAALERLFALASFLVSPRAPASSQDLRAFLDQPENRRFAPRVIELDLPPEYQTMSSTRVRDVVRLGGLPTDVPPIVVDFIRETGAYEAPRIGPAGEKIDRYAIREAVLVAAEDGRRPLRSAAAFRTLVRQRCAPAADRGVMGDG